MQKTPNDRLERYDRHKQTGINGNGRNAGDLAALVLERAVAAERKNHPNVHKKK
ncbi:MAG: hypothetical protein ACLTR6_05820 [Clostridium fessum]